MTWTWGYYSVGLQDTLTALPYTHHPVLEWLHGPLTRYVKLWVAHAPGMQGTFFLGHRLQRKPLVTDSGMHHVNGTCVRHVPVMYVRIAYPRLRGKRSRHSRHMRNPQVYVSGKRPIDRAYACVLRFIVLCRGMAPFDFTMFCMVTSRENLTMSTVPVKQSWKIWINMTNIYNRCQQRYVIKAHQNHIDISLDILYTV